MTDKEVVGRIDVRLSELITYKNGLKYDPIDTSIPPERRMNIDNEKAKAEIRIEELERLKKIIYTS